jgi:hypothetical protein
MRRLTVAATVLLVAMAISVGQISAISAHFVSGPTASLSTTTGDYTVSFKEAGLGNGPVTYSLTASTETFTFQCFTKSGNKPQGEPNSVSFSGVSTQTTLTPRNGQITGSISLIPELDGASCQGGGLVLFLIAVDYQGVTFADVTNNIVVTMPNLSASGLSIGPF